LTFEIINTTLKYSFSENDFIPQQLTAHKSTDNPYDFKLITKMHNNGGKNFGYGARGEKRGFKYS